MNLFRSKESSGYLGRLKQALRSTREGLTQKIEGLLGPGQSPITEEQFEEMEHALIAADIGVQTALEVIERVRESTRGSRSVTAQDIKNLVTAELRTLFLEGPVWEESFSSQRPHVTFVVGVNGVGKTTTIGKLVHRYKQLEKEVLICASDTFRAAAIEQLTIWSQRTQSEIVMQKPGADPAAVLFDAIAAGKARGKDVVIVDTAGRMHTKRNLMEELKKMVRIAGRELSGAPHDVYLVLDATTGQNALSQAREFVEAVGATGIIVTKLDGTAKGGIVAGIVKELKVPVCYIGTGEQIEDLVPFEPEAFVESLLGSAHGSAEEFKTESSA